MVPNWLSRILESLPGRPRTHIWFLMGMVMLVHSLDKILNSILLTLAVSLPLLIFVVKSDFSLISKEIMDLRDWVVVRAITSTFWISVGLWAVAGITNGIDGWMEVIGLMIGLFILWKDGRIFLAVQSRAKELPDWGTIALIKRRKEEGD